jgi:antitoxin VapB
MMPLNIRDPRAAELAKKLANRRGITMTAAIIGALENEINRERSELPMMERLKELAKKAKSLAGPNGRKMSKAEIDDMWSDV